MKFVIRRLWKTTQGQDLIEYALICGMVALAAVAGMPGLMNVIKQIFAMIASLITFLFG